MSITHVFVIPLTTTTIISLLQSLWITCVLDYLWYLCFMHDPLPASLYRIYRCWAFYYMLILVWTLFNIGLHLCHTSDELSAHYMFVDSPVELSDSFLFIFNKHFYYSAKVLRSTLTEYLTDLQWRQLRQSQMNIFHQVKELSVQIQHLAEALCQLNMQPASASVTHSAPLPYAPKPDKIMLCVKVSFSNVVYILLHIPT